jgi:hypothetical protein
LYKVLTTSSQDSSPGGTVNPCPATNLFSRFHVVLVGVQGKHWRFACLQMPAKSIQGHATRTPCKQQTTPGALPLAAPMKTLPESELAKSSRPKLPFPHSLCGQTAGWLTAGKLTHQCHSMAFQHDTKFSQSCVVSAVDSIACRSGQRLHPAMKRPSSRCRISRVDSLVLWPRRNPK